MDLFKKTFTLAFAVLLSIITYAQKESFKFEDTQHNFGTIEEKGGPAIHKFEFTNTGENPIKIKKVKASCGCTTPSWSKEVVPPGGTGHVTAKYNPRNRPGRFNKTLTITTDDNERIYLKIKGNVSKAELPPETKYPYLSGNLRFKNEVANVGAVMHDEVRTMKLPIYNLTETDVSLLGKVVLPPHLSISMNGETIPSKKHANVTLAYDPNKIDDWGERTDVVKFNIDGKESILKVTSNKMENFSDMSDEEKANAPEIKLNKTKLNFGDVKMGKKAKATITYTNNGKSDLIIRKINSTCGCTAVKSKKNVIQPGKSGKIIVKLDTSAEDYNQNNIITLICNDPKNSVHNIQVRANITN